MNLGFHDLILKCLTFGRQWMIYAFHAFDRIFLNELKKLCTASIHRLNETWQNKAFWCEGFWDLNMFEDNKCAKRKDLLYIDLPLITSSALAYCIPLRVVKHSNVFLTSHTVYLQLAWVIFLYPLDLFCMVQFVLFHGLLLTT